MKFLNNYSIFCVNSDENLVDVLKEIIKAESIDMSRPASVSVAMDTR